MNKSGPKKKESVKELKKRAESGDIEAQSALGLLYELGLDVPKADPQEAAKWWGKAAKSGSTVAQFSLAEIISKEFEDTEENRAMAQVLYKKAEVSGLVRPDKAVRMFDKQRGKSWKVLIVDPSMTHRGQVKSLLEAEGCEVIEAKNGDDGLTVLRRNLDVKLVLTEVNMPVLDGYGLIQAVNVNEQMKHIPVIVLSEEKNPEAIQKAKKSGVKGWILKPAKLHALRRFIQKVNEKKTVSKPSTEKKAATAVEPAKNTLPKKAI
ncbi:MAG: response regulator [Proteobacteria bacterium]|nr:response regulator [Pseudomonadota bacterium]